MLVLIVSFQFQKLRDKGSLVKRTWTRLDRIDLKRFAYFLGKRIQYEDRMQVVGFQKQKDKDSRKRVAVLLVLISVNAWIPVSLLIDRARHLVQESRSRTGPVPKVGGMGKLAGWDGIGFENDNLVPSRLVMAMLKRLMTDVPFGVLLSGRLDSSLVPAVASRYLATSEAARQWGSQLHTFGDLGGSGD
ncbi:hypothetical protein ACLB2K_002372 [Fragaria x ananassa]